MSEELKKRKSQNTDDLREIEQYIRSINPNVFDGIKDEKKYEILKSLSITLIQKRSHSGPLPDPETLEDYDRLIPKSAERIMQMAEKQLDHRHALESKVIPSQLKQSRAGQWFGFVLGVIGLGCGTFLAYSGQPYVGGLIAGTTVVSLVSVFVIGKRSQKKDLQNHEA